MFSVRIAAIALSVIAMALLLSTPFVDVLVIGGGVRWFAAYGVVVAIGLSAAAVAIAVTMLLFRLIGPSRTRLVAQILAAIIGAGFVIALQIAAILSYGTLSRFAVLTSDAAAAFAPDVDSIVWWPARAVLGDGEALLLLLGGGLMLLGARDGDLLRPIRRHRRARIGQRPAEPVRAPGQGVPRRLAAAGAAAQGICSVAPRSLADVADPDAAVIPGAAGGDAVAQLFRRRLAIVLVTPVIVMAAGQLAGGLAWLTISGEDAADLVATAPLKPSRVIRAKIEVVLITIAVIFAPLVAALLFASPLQAAVTALGIMIAAGFRHRDPALVPGAGQAQPVSPPPDLVAAGDLRRSLLLDRMGRDRGAGTGSSHRRVHQRPDDPGDRRRDLEAQPAPGLSALAKP